MILQCLGQFVISRLPDLPAVAVCRQMMGFVEHHQVPARCVQQTLDSSRTLQGVDAGDQAVVFGERVGLAVRNVAFGTEHLEVKAENLVQLSVPVMHQSGGHHHQRALEFATAGKLAQDQGSLDGLAQPDFVGNEEAPRRRRGNPVSQHDLVRQQIDLGGRERGRALHHGQRVCLE